MRMLNVPISAIFALEDAQIHICTTNCGNVVTYIKASVNQTFSLASTLNVPDIKPYDSYVWLRGYFDDS